MTAGLFAALLITALGVTGLSAAAVVALLRGEDVVPVLLGLLVVALVLVFLGGVPL